VMALTASTIILFLQGDQLIGLSRSEGPPHVRSSGTAFREIL
jgi:hypothetical protein